MTKTEQATLDELRMTEAELEARQAKVSQLLNGEATLGEQLKASIAIVQPVRIAEPFSVPNDKPPRKKRSDAGKPKPKPPAIAQKPGVLSLEQVGRLKDLIDTKQSRLAELDAINDQQAQALGAVDAATAELDAYLRELQGVK